MFRQNSDLIPLKHIQYNNDDRLNILEDGVPKLVLERYKQHPDDVIEIIEQLNANDVQAFLGKLLSQINTPEFGLFLNYIFNNDNIKNKIHDIFETFVTSVRKTNYVANAYIKEINPFLHTMVTNWLGFGKIHKKKISA